MFQRLIKKNDWVQIWNTSGVWKDTHGDTTGRCHYMIDWSESRGKFRLRISGRNPEDHGLYEVALDTLTKLNLAQINDPARIRDEKLKQLGI